MRQRLTCARGLLEPLGHIAFAVPGLTRSVAIARRLWARPVFGNGSGEVANLNTYLRHSATQIRNHAFALPLIHFAYAPKVLPGARGALLDATTVRTIFDSGRVLMHRDYEPALKPSIAMRDIASIPV